MTNPRKYIASFGLSLAFANLFNAALVILKETDAGVMGWMRAATGHHWVTHGAVVLALFLLLGMVLAGARPGRRAGELTGVAAAIAISTIIGGLMIAAFFLIA